ncbi:MAG: hypothetical protein F4080_11555, partial [Holophagales bacterium]|nr:hypothetical protein [Holophagales bacterium]
MSSILLATQTPKSMGPAVYRRRRRMHPPGLSRRRGSRRTRHLRVVAMLRRAAARSGREWRGSQGTLAPSWWTGSPRSLLSAAFRVGCGSRNGGGSHLPPTPWDPLHSEPDWAGRRRQAVGLELVSSRANILLIQNVETQDSGRMRRMVSVVTRVVALVVCVPGLASFGGGLAQAATPPDFESEVLPVLKSRCFACHGPLRQRGSLRLDSRPAMLIGGGRG